MRPYYGGARQDIQFVFFKRKSTVTAIDERDPRIDPQPGDVLVGDGGYRRYIVKRRGKYVVYEVYGLSGLRIQRVTRFQLWAKTAEVMRRAEDERKGEVAG